MIRAGLSRIFRPDNQRAYLYCRKRGSPLDELVVAVLVNPEKRSTFSEEERQIMAREALVHLPNVKVKFFEGLW